jgi:hypothetical protein
VHTLVLVSLAVLYDNVLRLSMPYPGGLGTLAARHSWLLIVGCIWTRRSRAGWMDCPAGKGHAFDRLFFFLSLSLSDSTRAYAAVSLVLPVLKSTVTEREL